MSNWIIHWLEAEGSLEPWRTEITAQIAAAENVVASLIDPPRIDILIAHRCAKGIIPELGIGAFAQFPSLFSMSCDPANENFGTSLSNRAVIRLALHEVHHCLRMVGPGFGRSLGEALVSEGLAGRFASHLIGTPPELWENIADGSEIINHMPDTKTLASTDYDYDEWFYGAGELPRWTGYSLGYEIVGRWIDRCNPSSASDWIETSANEIISKSGCGLRKPCV
jgi:hypothetical protein